MVRGHGEYILSDADAFELRRKDPKHPRIKRSLATIHALDEIRRRLQPAAGVCLSISKPPLFISDLVKHYNSKYLSNGNDLKLNRRNVWRIFFRRHYGRKSYFLPEGVPISHKAIYIQRRHNQPDEPVAGEQKRKKSSCESPLGSDYQTISNVTTIDQSGSPRLIYLCQNLHSNFHGSMQTAEIESNNVILEFVGIGHTVLSPHTTTSRGVSRDEDVTVAFSTAAYFRNMEITLQKRGFCGGLDGLEMSVALDLLSHGVTDKIRMNRKITNDEETVSKRLVFGFGRIQRDSYNLNRHLNGTSMPGANTKSFDKLPRKSKEQLMILFECASQFTLRWNKESFPNQERNTLCAGYLNSQLGFPTSKSLFEYYDIVLSHNTILRKHCDVKNCHRSGYNICCVYSYYVEVNGEEYKVSIIMTSRTTVGSALNKALNPERSQRI